MSQPVRRVPSVGAIARKLGFGSNPTDERTFLLEALPHGSVGAEIGVHEGGFSRKILRVVDPAVLHLIDPWKHESAEEYSQSWYGGKVRGGQVSAAEPVRPLKASAKRPEERTAASA